MYSLILVVVRAIKFVRLLDDFKERRRGESNAVNIAQFRISYLRHFLYLQVYCGSL